VTDDEKQMIEAQGWENDPIMKGVKLFAKFGRFWRRKNSLAKKKDGGCVFLDEKGGCRIHAKFGSAGKPLACRLYPFLLVPTGDHWKIGLRFACPSASQDLGRPLDAHLPEIREYAEIYQKQAGLANPVIIPPQLQRGQSVPWSDLFLFMRSLRGIISNPTKSLEWRLRKALALAQLCRSAAFDKITGNRLTEFLELVCEDVEEDVLPNPEDLAPPGWVGRLLFRPAVALFARKDSGPDQGTSRGGRLALLWAAWKFAWGGGRVPRLHRAMPKTTFQALEQPCGPMPKASEELLTRYFIVKLESMQFCGPTMYHRQFWDGFESLVFLFPATMWLSRVFTDRSREEAIRMALQIVDDNFGFNPMLSSARQAWAMRTLASRGEMARLVAWYSR
jgi:lysine-N-methylase